MDNKFKGKRAEIGVYDDAWIRGDDGIECVVSSPKIMHDRFTAERHSKILEELDGFVINPEYESALIRDILNNIIKKSDESND